MNADEELRDAVATMLDMEEPESFGEKYARFPRGEVQDVANALAVAETQHPHDGAEPFCSTCGHGEGHPIHVVVATGDESWRQLQVDLWDAINRYVRRCGGDPSKHVQGNELRQLAVVDVEAAVLRWAERGSTPTERAFTDAEWLRAYNRAVIERDQLRAEVAALRATMSDLGIKRVEDEAI